MVVTKPPRPSMVREPKFSVVLNDSEDVGEGWWNHGGGLCIYQSAGPSESRGRLMVAQNTASVTVKEPRRTQATGRVGTMMTDASKPDLGTVGYLWMGLRSTVRFKLSIRSSIGNFNGNHHSSGVA